MRYLLQLQYRGTNYVGWQSQPNGTAVQHVLEDTFSTVYQQPIKVYGCGRTDAGVHAECYFAHLDLPLQLDQTMAREWLGKINRMLPKDVALVQVRSVSEDFHARFEAISRTYQYRVSRSFDPFLTDLSYRFPQADKIDLDLLREAASLVLKYQEFFPFCKTKSGTDHYKCTMMHSSWEVNERNLVYTVQANRFLRGMVRLLVGMQLLVATGKMPLESVQQSMDRQTPLQGSWSAPAHGLFLTDVKYPE